MAERALPKSGPEESFTSSHKLPTITYDTTLVAIVVALIVVLLTFVLLYFARVRRNLRRNVLLIGLCESGKTLLYSQLVHKTYVDTHTSIKENAGLYYPANRKGALRVVDLPGHERLRMQFFDQYKSMARGIVCVIDSLNFQKEIKDIAQFLYTILSDRVVNQHTIPILIACNKQDETLAKSCQVIQKQLEKEMNTVRITESATLDSTTSTGNNNTFLGKRGKDFEFGHLSPLTVDFVDCSAIGAEKDDEESEAELNAVEEWLMKIA